MKFGQVDNMNSVNFDLPVVSDKTKSILLTQNSDISPNFYFGSPGWSDRSLRVVISNKNTTEKVFRSICKTI